MLKRERERVGCGKQREATAPIKSLVKLQHWFLSLRWKTCLRQNCSLGFSACSEGPPFWAEHSDDDVNMNKENNKEVNIEEWWLVQSNKTGIYNQYLWK